MITATKSDENDTRVLKHFTRKKYLNSIQEIGLQLEGWNVFNDYEKGFRSKQLVTHKESIEKGSKFLGGRYVWLTKGTQVNAINCAAHMGIQGTELSVLENQTVYLEVDDTGLDIVSWKLVRQKLGRTKTAKKYLDTFESIATLCGDDVDDWYVCRSAIAVSNLTLKVSLDTNCSINWDDMQAA
tara:strand:+ start:129 stop:680 length:552 start_codon:yes stop_codon:yes gene_type:complete